MRRVISSMRSIGNGGETGKKGSGVTMKNNGRLRSGGSGE